VCNVLVSQVNLLIRVTIFLENKSVALFKKTFTLWKNVLRVVEREDLQSKKQSRLTVGLQH
jgi:predicted transposase